MPFIIQISGGPGQENCPAAWVTEGIKKDAYSDESIEAIAQQIYDYTFKTLIELDKSGLMPEFVQVDHEINRDMCVPYNPGYEWTMKWFRQAMLLNSGTKAIRDAGKKSQVTPRIVMHKANPNASVTFLQR